MEHFAKIIGSFQLLTIFAKSSTLGVRLGSEYASVISVHFEATAFSCRFAQVCVTF